MALSVRPDSAADSAAGSTTGSTSSAAPGAAGSSSATSASAPATASASPSARRLATLERLLDAATEAFAEDGLRGASVEAICSRAGFTRGAFYSNFSSKEELFLALLEREHTRRATALTQKTVALSPELSNQARPIDAEQAAAYIAEFLAPVGESTDWVVLETEFALLAMRDPASVPGYADLLERSIADLATLVEEAMAAAGRRFTLTAAHAVALLAGEHDRALRITAVAGPGAAGGLDDLPTLISELLFAITEPVAG